jgi:3-phenylpropionate/trans-cinnamate dioxygenase ferredoxin reductase component
MMKCSILMELIEVMMADRDPIVIVGGGHAGAQLCAALAAAGRAPDVHLVCDDAELPYHRPPLSKAFLKEAATRLQWHRPETWYRDAGITVHRANAAVKIDRARRLVHLRSGDALPYKILVLATGARARRLPHLSESLSNVALVRTAADAIRMRALLNACLSVTVIGGGFIGLEIAATARALGKAVQVLESAPRLLMRAVSPELSEHVLRTHLDHGIDVRVGVAVGGFEVAGDRLMKLAVDGAPQDVELVVLGIGAVPDHDLASAAGLHCDNGIVVDEHMRTSDPAILAIGDCTLFPEHATGRRIRLESVQNANDQARTASSTITGELRAYSAVPWFWSDQGDMRLQMVGLMPAEGTRYRRVGQTSQSFSILHYVGGRLACIESVNAPKDHLAARKLLEAGGTVPPEAACNPELALKLA